MNNRPARNFYEIQSRQWKRSLPIFAALLLFYFLAIGLIALAAVASVGLFSARLQLFSGPFMAKFGLGVLATSLVIALFHFFDARKFGAAYILKRLDARPPDDSDRYHKQLANTVEEIRLAAGLPKVKAYVIPSFVINSLALVEADGTPAVAVTEGLLADGTRDELEAVAAHELAHISRGDAFYVTLVCSLANFMEKVRAALEPDDIPAEERGSDGRGGAPPVLIYVAVVFSSFFMHLLSMLLSREREILADASAAELSRNPAALARVLYKAHLKSTFVGDFSLTYSPMFIIAPKLSSDEDEGFFSRLFNSHPPVMRRIKILAQMAGLGTAKIIEQVWESQKMRMAAQGVLLSFDEIPREARKVAEPWPEPGPEAEKAWIIQDAAGKWQGPFDLAELLRFPGFTPLRRIKNLHDDIDAPAREFSQVRQGLQRMGRKKPVNPSRQNRCPRCGIPLAETFYEGVDIRNCQQCGGKLVEMAKMNRILLRKEYSFSEALLDKARKFREQFLLNPVKEQRAKDRDAHSLICPSCGFRMIGRPYNYQYFVPVDKCLSCYRIWFDADELEILQILIEKKN
jgi:heat shock protein HtpX